MLEQNDIDALQHARHPDPFAVLGMRRILGGMALHAILPGALSVRAVHAHTLAPLVDLQRLGASDVFGVSCPGHHRPEDYRLQVTWQALHADEQPTTTVMDDPYRFGPVLGDTDIWLLSEGSHQRPYEALGAHPCMHEGVAGVRFAVWAPNAKRVSVVGGFNRWDGRVHPMRLRMECGVWELFIPGLGEGELYKFELISAQGERLLKADPFALRTELRPQTASVVQALPSTVRFKPERAAANAMDKPMSIYEVHLGSWRKADGWRWLNYRELAEQLVPYAKDLGFTHLELLPITEHPFDNSWGYQPVGLYAPTARFGSPDDFRFFVDAAHAAGLGVILDWVPAHFPTDAHGLGRFDGTHLYEHADPKEGYHPDWNTLIFNFGRNEVRNYLVGNALYWLERFGVDGLRVDAVASMLYRDYSRKDGEWIPNQHGGRENLEAIAFLRHMNHAVGTQCPGRITIAEESTAFPGVSRPPSPDLQSGGLGFHHKWNMGWMHDTLGYMGQDPVHRRYHHQQLTFGLMYAFSENFVLPFSHDEVVHGKGSLLAKMAGDPWQRFANLRSLYGLMWGYPGKKLLFMGCEFGQASEWNSNDQLPWHCLDEATHRGVQHLVRDLNTLYQATPALYEQDHSPNGFAWVTHDDADHSVVAFLRWSVHGQCALVVCNFTPVPRPAYRLGVPQEGQWRCVLNTDASVYGGSGAGSFASQTDEVPRHGHDNSICVDLPPLATMVWLPTQGVGQA